MCLSLSTRSEVRPDTDRTTTAGGGGGGHTIGY